MYKPKHFQWHEFMPKPKDKAQEALYKRIWLWVIDSRIFMLADQIREYYGVPVTINNWFWGGQFSLRGWRPFDCLIGALLSMHKFGRAFDFDVKGISPAQVRKDALAGKFPLVTAIEVDISWNHFDVRNCEPIMQIKPK